MSVVCFKEEAWRSCRHDAVRLFVPARLLQALATIVATMLVMVEVSSLGHRGVVTRTSRTGNDFFGLVALVVTCGHVLPLILVRQTPERVIEILLPSFNFIVGTLSPVTRPLIGLLNGVGRHHTDGPRPFEREKEVAREGVGGEPDFLADEHEERKLLESVVEFGDTLIREVMPPRPDIGAVKSSATLLELTDLFCEQLCVGEVNVEILEAERRRIQPVRMHRRLVIKEEPSDA